MLTTIAIEILAVSGKRKESMISTSNHGSIEVDNMQKPTLSTTTDIMTTKMTKPGNIKIKIDAAAISSAK